MNGRFLQRINCSRPVIVDFYADWCAPCKQVAPVLQQVKQELGGIRILKVNVDLHPVIAGHYNIRRLPTIMVFMHGKPVWTGEGVHSAGEIKAVLSKEIGVKV